MLNLRTWEPVTIKAGLQTVGCEIRRLNFLQSKPFTVVMARVRMDKVLREIAAIYREQEAATRAHLARLQAATVAHALPINPPVDLKPDAKGASTVDPLEALAEALEAQIRQAGHPLPLLSVEEDDAQAAALNDAMERRTRAIEEFFDSVPDGFVESAFRDYVRNVSGLVVDGAPATTGEALLAVADQQTVMDVLEQISIFAKLSAAQKNDSSSPSTSGPAAPTDGGATPAPSVESEDGTRPAIAMETPAGAP